MGNPFLHASTNGTAANVLVGLGTVSFKLPYDAASWTEQGYTIEGCTLLYTPTFVPSVVPWSTVEADAELVSEDIRLVLTLAESTLATLRLAYPGVYDLDASDIDLGRSVSRAWNPVGFKVVGEGPSSTTRTITMPYGRVDNSVGQEYRLDIPRAAAIGFKVMLPPDNPDGDIPFNIADA